MNSILIYDSGGSYVHCAASLVGKADKVGYHCPHSGAFPRADVAQIGKGIEGVEWVDNFFAKLNEYETLFFPDCRDGDLQVYLRENGKNVFGSGNGSELENFRWESNEILEDVGLPKVKMERVFGIDKLRKFLKEHDDIYVKSNFRGSLETFHSQNYKLIEPQLDELAHDLGKFKDEFEFICVFPIDGSKVVEVGGDPYSIDGQYPDTWLYSYEIKDLGSVSVVKKKNLISKKITESFDKIAPVLKEYQYRNFISNEIRIKDKNYVTDWTCRLPSPIAEGNFMGMKNIADVIAQGAKGIMVQPIYEHKYMVEAIITSEFAEKHWQPIHIDKSVRDYVRIKNLTIIDDIYYYIPLIEMKQIGAVYAWDNTIDGAQKKLEKYAAGISGFDIKVNTDCMEKAMEIINLGKQIGISF